MKQIDIKEIETAYDNLRGVVKKTPLEYNRRLSRRYKADIYIKREDLQDVRSYKIRGSFNKMSMLSITERKLGVVAASAGNHAQGVAYSANNLKIKTVIFMPTTTPLQKIERVKYFGDGFVEVRLFGSTYDEACNEALKFCEGKKAVLVHPFDDTTVIAGQGTLGVELYEELGEKIDYVIAPIGGGGFISGVASFFNQKNSKVKVFGAEPQGSPSTYNSLKKGVIETLTHIDTFVDGAAVKTPGTNTFQIIKNLVKDVVLVAEGQICTTMIELYQNEGIVAEPAGALSVAALEQYKEKIKGKTVVCILSGGNNDILRYPEIMERSLVYLGRKHYLILNFAQKPGQLRAFVDKALGPTDDIVRFEYIKKTSKEKGPALVGIELAKKEDFAEFVKRLDAIGISYNIIEPDDPLYGFLI